MEGRCPKLQPPGSVESSLKVPSFCSCAPFSIQIGPSGAPPPAPVGSVPWLMRVTPSSTSREQRSPTIVPCAAELSVSCPEPPIVVEPALVSSELTARSPSRVRLALVRASAVKLLVEPSGIVSEPLCTLTCALVDFRPVAVTLALVTANVPAPDHVAAFSANEPLVNSSAVPVAAAKAPPVLLAAPPLLSCSVPACGLTVPWLSKGTPTGIGSSLSFDWKLPV